MKTAFIYTDRYLNYDYGPAHPLKMIRLRLTYDILNAYKIFDNPQILLVEPTPCNEDDILPFHKLEYIEVLKEIDRGITPINSYQYGLGWGDNPIFAGVYEGSLFSAGGSLMAARMVETGEVDIAFNIAGGLHHAMPNRASGFCYLNDPVIAIIHLIKKGKRVVYIDIDAHHGDGIQNAFYERDDVLTLSLHENGHYLFPGTGFVEEMGKGKGRGYSVNLPFYPGTDDKIFVDGFEEIVPPFIDAFRPDIMVTQLGVDTMSTDPLAHLQLTSNGFCRMVKMMKSFNIPWVALGGGGYNVTNVARCWTLAFGIMNDIELPDKLPRPSLNMLYKNGLTHDRLRDFNADVIEDDSEVIAMAKKGIDAIKHNILPLIDQTG